MSWLTLFVVLGVAATVISVARDVRRFGYDHQFARGMREPRPVLLGLAAAGVIVAGTASDLTWWVAPLAASVFVAVTIWVSGREHARRKTGEESGPNA